MFPSTIGSKRCKVISTMPFNMYQLRRLKRRQVDLNYIYIYIYREREREREDNNKNNIFLTIYTRE